MYKIVRKQELNASVTLMEIEAPFVARKAKAGQFIIFRIDEMGERVPLTIAGYDREKGTVTIIFQKVGFSTNALGALKEGDYIHDFVGPLGKPTPVEGKKKVCVVGGGVGCAIALPSAKAFKEAGAEVTVIVGFRSKDIVILEDEFKAAADRLILMTDDGTYGRHGLVTQPLQELLEAGETFDEVLAIGSSDLHRNGRGCGLHSGAACTVGILNGTVCQSLCVGNGRSRRGCAGTSKCHK